MIGQNNNTARICSLKKEAEWLRHLVAATSDDLNVQSTGMNALKSLLDQMRIDQHQPKSDIAGKPSVSDSIKAAENEIRDLQSKIQAIKNKPIESTSNKLLRSETDKQARLRDQVSQMKEKCNRLQAELEESNQRIGQCRTELQMLREQKMEESNEQAV